MQRNAIYELHHPEKQISSWRSQCCLPLPAPLSAEGLLKELFFLCGSSSEPLETQAWVGRQSPARTFGFLKESL